jgi:hypothetical protein
MGAVVVDESVAAGAVIDVVSAVIDAEAYAGGVGVSLSVIDEDKAEDKLVVVVVEEDEFEVVATVVVEPIVLPPPTAVAAPPALASKTDKSLSAHATDTP